MPVDYAWLATHGPLLGEGEFLGMLSEEIAVERHHDVCIGEVVDRTPLSCEGVVQSGCGFHVVQWFVAGPGRLWKTLPQ